MILLTAGQIKEGAVNGGDPEVGGARVKQHAEVLRRGANTDHPIVLGLRKHKGHLSNYQRTDVLTRVTLAFRNHQDSTSECKAAGVYE